MSGWCRGLSGEGLSEGCLGVSRGYLEGIFGNTLGVYGECLLDIRHCLSYVWGVSGVCLVCTGLINRESPKFTWSSLFLF